MIGRRARWLTGLTVVSLVLALLPRPRRAPRDVESRRRTPVERAFERARSAKRQMSGCDGDARADLRELAIATYESVYLAASNPRQERAEAAFRAGELARAAGDVARARSAFEHAADGAQPSFSFRAELELGHLARRAGDDEKAAQHYEKLLLGPCEDPYLRDETLFWLARVRSESGREQAAIDILQRLRARLNEGSLHERTQRELGHMGIETHCDAP